LRLPNFTAWLNGSVVKISSAVKLLLTTGCGFGRHSLRFGADYRRLSPISGVQEYRQHFVNTWSEILAGSNEGNSHRQ
jgi:hypothetical protein